jgi:hypothetical protein
MPSYEINQANLGFKVHGTTYNSFLENMVADEWYYASAVGPAYGQDSNQVLIIFQSMRP